MRGSSVDTASSARDAAKDPVEPFRDRAGYLDYIDQGEARFRKLLADQQ